MREQLLDWLICPNCGEGTWDANCSEPTAGGVIRKGEVFCLTCRSRYAIKDGILDLLPHPPESVLRERAGWQRFLQGAAEELAEEWILSLPRVDANVTSNAQSIAHWKRQANNFFGLMELLGLRGDERVLEVGAGRCWASAHLARLGCEVVALDVVRDRHAGGLETGSVYLRHGTPYFNRVLASMEKLPFRPETFDLVVSVASIHHSLDLDQVVAQCARVLRPGGRLALTSEPCIRIFKAKRVDNTETEAGINEHTYGLLDYRRAFAAAGLAPRYFLPGALVAMLEEGGVPTGSDGIRSWLFGLARRAWRYAPLRKLLQSQAANRVGLLFFEYGLTAVAHKPVGSGVR
ncbi:MAG TPA: methyltransferase domain-containing protein [Anaerolineae bacterium]|nr:methyltransferase domain-containing protein [Anaerolineae bacterium]